MANELVRNIVKDFSIEFRNPTAFFSSLAFAAITTTAISMVARSYRFEPLVQSILLWIIIFFAAMNSLLHVYTRETDQGTDFFLRLHSTAISVYAAKLIFNSALLLVLQMIIAPLGVAFLQMDVRSPLFFITIIAAGGMAIAGTATILSAMVAKSGGKGSLFTIISFPILLPVLWVSIASTEKAMARNGIFELSSVLFLLAFSGLIIALSFLLIRFIWLDE